MDNGQRTLKDLFDGRKIFRIPDYQRAYAWEEKQLKDFLDDFKNQKIGKDYFFGTILFQESGKRGAFDLIDIVDGQQRITTLIMFVKTLLKFVSDEDDLCKETYIKNKSTYKLELLSDDNEFFVTYILADNTRIPPEVITTPSQKKLAFARDYFERELSCDFSVSQMQELLQKVECTKVLIYSVVDKAEATLIFETTNDRGKSLSNLEKTKSFLMYKNYMAASEPEQQLSIIQSRFGSIYKTYSEIENEIDENSILQYNFIAYEVWTLSQKKEYQKYVDMVKNKINSLLGTGKYQEAITYIENYSIKLKETFAAVKAILRSVHPMFHDVRILNHLGTFWPLLIKAYNFDETEEKENFIHVCHLCEIYSFRVYSICKKFASKGQTTIYGIARDFDGDFNDLEKKLIAVIIKNGSKSDFIKKLNTQDFNREYTSLTKNYFFWKYENYLRENYQPVAAPITYSTFLNTDKRTRFSIEHIIPQNPKEETKKVITDALQFDEITNEFEETYLHSIGNLTIDPSSANSSKGQKEFEEKESRYFKKAPFKSQNELEDFLTDENHWTHKSIQTRQKKLIEFAVKQWCQYDDTVINADKILENLEGEDEAE